MRELFVVVLIFMAMCGLVFDVCWLLRRGLKLFVENETLEWPLIALLVTFVSAEALFWMGYVLVEKAKMHLAAGYVIVTLFWALGGVGFISWIICLVQWYRRLNEYLAERRENPRKKFQFWIQDFFLAIIGYGGSIVFLTSLNFFGSSNLFFIIPLMLVLTVVSFFLFADIQRRCSSLDYPLSRALTQVGIFIGCFFHIFTVLPVWLAWRGVVKTRRVLHPGTVAE